MATEETNAPLKMKKKKRGKKTIDQRSRVFDSHKATVRFFFLIYFENDEHDEMTRTPRRKTVPETTSRGRGQKSERNLG